jgi:hypothetical protein
MPYAGMLFLDGKLLNAMPVTIFAAPKSGACYESNG